MNKNYLLKTSIKLGVSIGLSFLLNFKVLRSGLSSVDLFDVFTIIFSIIVSFFALAFINNEFIEGKHKIRSLIRKTTNISLAESVLKDVNDVKILPQLDSYFKQSWTLLIKDISTLKDGAVDINANLRKQFHVAASIANFYRSSKIKNVYATSLDLPSNFFFCQ